MLPQSTYVLSTSFKRLFSDLTPLISLCEIMEENPVGSLMSQVASCLSKFHAQYVERRYVLNLDNMYKELWQAETHRWLWT